MTTWILIFYMSAGIGSSSTGGPATIDGFSKPEYCAAAHEEVKRLPKYDWGYCISVKK